MSFRRDHAPTPPGDLPRAADPEGMGRPEQPGFLTRGSRRIALAFPCLQEAQWRDPLGRPGLATWRSGQAGLAGAVPRDPPGVRSPLTVAAPRGRSTHFAWLPGGRRLTQASITMLYIAKLFMLDSMRGVGGQSRPLSGRGRVRYKGTHPRRFDEKYKEHDPEKYPDDIRKVMESGKTPAGMHRPVCVNEVLDILKPEPGDVGLDATLGYGGHASEVLKKIAPKGKLYALDVDPAEILRTEKRLRDMGYGEKTLIIRRSNFAGSGKLLTEVKRGFDFILADLGVSSMQLDDPARGFTFKHEGRLDLRLNPERGQPAAQVIKSLDEKQLEKLFRDNSDEPCAQPIARAVFASRNKIDTTTQLADVIAYAMGAKSSSDCLEEVTDSIRRVFQALRIYVNDEFSALEQFLRALPLCLRKKGRVAILTFHSGEDNRVMSSFEKGLKDGVYSDISHKRIRPSPEEQHSNPRSRSALLRWAIKK